MDYKVAVTGRTPVNSSGDFDYWLFDTQVNASVFVANLAKNEGSDSQRYDEIQIVDLSFDTEATRFIKESMSNED